MGFQQGLSGLNAASKNLEVIGNNIANANTYGAKVSRAEFADVYANTLSGTSSAVGIGTTVAAIAQQFTQGNITTTESPLDLAINGDGFFQVQTNGSATGGIGCARAVYPAADFVAASRRQGGLPERGKSLFSTSAIEAARSCIDTLIHSSQSSLHMASLRPPRTGEDL